MSYYDDLGVRRNASPEDIRDSYRALARLLHPDQQTEPSLKSAAEAQMRRVNDGYAVLSDVSKRRRYDSELMLTAGPISPLIRVRRPRTVKKSRIPSAAIAWGAAALACLGVILWIAGEGQSAAGHAPADIQDDVPYPLHTGMQTGMQTGKPAAARAAANRETSVQISSRRKDQETIEFLQRELKIVRAQRDAAMAEQHSAGASIAHIEEAASPNFLPMVAIPPTEEHLPLDAPDPKLSQPAPFQKSDFGGFWIYPKPRSAAKDTKLYPPDFIEAAIVEHDGTIRGKYRARYHVSDRAISPNVNFEFEGKVIGPILNLDWKGDGGSKGEIEIRLLSNTEMELNWKATTQGRTLALVNGTAVLMRRPN